MLSRTYWPRFFTAKTVYTVLGLCWLTVLAFFTNSDWRKGVRNLVRGADRKVLATLKDDLDASGVPISVIKVQEDGALYLEFYSQKKQNSDSGEFSTIELLQKLPLSNSIDGYVTFMGEATNLAAANLDDDPFLELVVPSFNLEFAPSLEVVKYLPTDKKFILMSSFYIPKDLIQGFQQEGR
jgi:hypothetical protein